MKESVRNNQIIVCFVTWCILHTHGLSLQFPPECRFSKGRRLHAFYSKCLKYYVKYTAKAISQMHEPWRKARHLFMEKYCKYCFWRGNEGLQIRPLVREWWDSKYRAGGSILAWIVILSVYGADAIAEVKLLISPYLCWSLDLWNQLLGV